MLLCLSIGGIKKNLFVRRVKEKKSFSKFFCFFCWLPSSLSSKSRRQATPQQQAQLRNGFSLGDHILSSRRGKWVLILILLFLNYLWEQKTLQVELWILWLIDNTCTYKHFLWILKTYICYHHIQYFETNAFLLKYFNIQLSFLSQVAKEISNNLILIRIISQSRFRVF